MRHTLSLRGLVVVSLILTATSASAQRPVSDSDFISVINPADGSHYVQIWDVFADTNFAVAVMIDNSTGLSAISIPLDFVGHPGLNIDTTTITPPDILGVTYGPAGRDAGWTLKTSLVNNVTKTILLGFVSFAGVPARRDTLCYIHWDLDGSGLTSVVRVDTAGIAPSSGLHMVDSITLSPTDFTPQWTPVNIGIGHIGVGTDREALPARFTLHANFPNPFNASTTIRYSAEAPSSLTLAIHNILGQHVRTLVDQAVAAGEHSVTWNGRDDLGLPVASGVYLIVLQAGGERQTRRALLLK